MSVPPEKLQWIRQWVIKAENDLTAAEYLLTLKDDCPTDIVGFHAQQCAEKYIKAWLSWLDIDFPQSHDLRELLTLLPKDKSLPLTDGEAETLSDYAVSARYPDDMEYISIHEAAEAVEIAKKVRMTVRSIFPQGVLS